MAFSAQELESDVNKIKRNHESWLSHVVGCLDLKGNPPTTPTPIESARVKSKLSGNESQRASSVRVLYGDPAFISKFDEQSSQDIADLLSDLSGEINADHRKVEDDEEEEYASTKLDMTLDEACSARIRTKSNVTDIYRLFHIPTSHESTNQQSIEEFIKTNRENSQIEEMYSSTAEQDEESTNEIKFTDAVKISINMEEATPKSTRINQSEPKIKEVENIPESPPTIEITSVNKLESPTSRYSSRSPSKRSLVPEKLPEKLIENPPEKVPEDSHDTLLLEDLITMGSETAPESLLFAGGIRYCGEESKPGQSFNLEDLITSERCEDCNSSPRVTLQEVLANECGKFTEQVSISSHAPVPALNLPIPTMPEETSTIDKRLKQFQWNLKDDFNQVRTGESHRAYCWTQESDSNQGTAVHSTTSSDVLLKEIFIKVQKVPKKSPGGSSEPSTTVQQVEKESTETLPKIFIENEPRLKAEPIVDGGYKTPPPTWPEPVPEQDITTQRRLQDIQNRLMMIGNRLNCINKRAGFNRYTEPKASSSDEANVLFNREQIARNEGFCRPLHQGSSVDGENHSVRTYGGGERTAPCTESHVAPGMDVSFEDCLSLQSHISGTEFVVQKDIPIVITGQSNLRVLPCESEVDMDPSVEKLKQEKNILLKELHSILNQLVLITTNISPDPEYLQPHSQLLSNIPEEVEREDESERCFIQDCSSTSTQCSTGMGGTECFYKDSCTTNLVEQGIMCERDLYGSHNSQDSIEHEFVSCDGTYMRGSASPVHIQRVRKVYTPDAPSTMDDAGDVTDSMSDIQVITYTSCAEEIIESDLVYETEPTPTIISGQQDSVWGALKGGGPAEMDHSEVNERENYCENCGDVPISNDSIKTEQLLDEIKKVHTVSRKISFLKGIPSSLEFPADNQDSDKLDEVFGERIKSGCDGSYIEPLSAKSSGVMRTVWKKPMDELPVPSTEVSLKSICIPRGSRHSKRHCKKKCHHKKKK